jgi:hypothetical protein
MVALLPPTAYPVDQRYGLIAGDFTGDGKLDSGLAWQRSYQA